MLNSIDELEEGGIYHHTITNRNGELIRDMLLILPDVKPISLYSWI